MCVCVDGSLFLSSMGMMFENVDHKKPLVLKQSQQRGSVDHEDSVAT